MSRLTLSQVLPAVADALAQNQSSQRALNLLNAAQEELLNKARWVGTRIKFRVWTTGPFITWPREIEVLEGIKVCGRPLQLHNQWYEFLEFGADDRHGYSGGEWLGGGYWRGNQGGGIAVDQGEVISFDDVCPNGNPKKLKVYAQATEDVNARILLQFYDDDGNYVRSNDPTEGWVDGEFVSINATTPATTINTVSNWVGVQKPITNGVVRITELDTVTNLERLLAVYQPSETNPSYRRSKLPNLVWADRANQPRPVSVFVIGKQRFIPALSPRDYLVISMKSAIVEMAVSIYNRNNKQPQQAQFFENKAVQLLDEQLASWIGDSTITVPQFNLATGAGAGPMNYI